MFHQVDFSVPAFSDRSITVTHSRMEDTYYDVNDSQSQQEEDNEQELIDQDRVYNINEVKAFLDELCCMICFHIVSEPVCCEQCEALYCRVCIREWFMKSAHRQVCPCCRTDSQEYFNKNPFYILNTGNIEFIKNKPSLITTQVPKILNKLLSKLLLRCRHEGCEEIITYEFRLKHERLYCGYAEIACPNYGCLLLVKRKDLQDHIDQDCSHTLLECRYCSGMIERCELESHLNACDHKLVTCHWCKDQQYMYELKMHMEECSLRRVSCQICTKEFYLEKYKLHTHAVCYKELWEQEKKQTTKMQERILKLEIENAELKKKIDKKPLQEEEEEKINYPNDFEEFVESDQENVQIEEVIEVQNEEDTLIKQLKQEFDLQQQDQQSTICSVGTQQSLVVTNWLDNLMNELLALEQQQSLL